MVINVGLKNLFVSVNRFCWIFYVRITYMQLQLTDQTAEFIGHDNEFIFFSMEERKKLDTR